MGAKSGAKEQRHDLEFTCLKDQGAAQRTREKDAETPSGRMNMKPRFREAYLLCLEANRRMMGRGETGVQRLPLDPNVRVHLVNTWLSGR